MAPAPEEAVSTEVFSFAVNQAALVHLERSGAVTAG
jgi:hypothetical protein